MLPEQQMPNNCAIFLGYGKLVTRYLRKTREGQRFLIRSSLCEREARELREISAVNWRRLEKTTVEPPGCSGLAHNEPQVGKQRMTCEGSIRCSGS